MNALRASLRRPPAVQTPPPGTIALAEADRCVLCGLCVPHCPTYRLTQDENESPRGRISLLRAVTRGQLSTDNHVAAHLSHCLACRACERVCPSGVRYGALLHAGRAILASQRGIPARVRLGLALIARPRLLRRATALLRLYRQTGVQRLLRRLGALRPLGLERADRLLALGGGQPRFATSYPAYGPTRGQVVLFLGCLAPILDSETIRISIRLLTRLGFDVLVPSDQVCCGGLHREAGDTRGAERLLNQNERAFGTNLDPVLTLASGCGAALLAGSGPLANRVRDIHEFLAESALPPATALAPLPETIAVHEPCSLRNGLRADAALYRLLARIPELHAVPLPENAWCCGGAGGYVLREPEFSDRLRESKVRQIVRLRPNRVVTTNLGCALHLSAGLREVGLALPVIHPLVLFDQQLRNLKPPD